MYDVPQELNEIKTTFLILINNFYFTFLELRGTLKPSSIVFKTIKGFNNFLNNGVLVPYWFRYSGLVIPSREVLNFSSECAD